LPSNLSERFIKGRNEDDVAATHRPASHLAAKVWKGKCCATAYTIAIALAISLVLSLTLSACAFSYLLKGGSEEDTWLVRACVAV